MQFREWLINEEIWPNGTATVYHRTNSEAVNGLLANPFKPGEGDMYGKGLYTTFAIESQFVASMEKTYGSTLIKFKVTDLNEYVICQKSVAQQLLGKNYKISDQLERLNLSNLYNSAQIKSFDIMMETGKYSSKLALEIFGTNRNIQYKAKGLIYYGPNDGYCLLKYLPVQDGTITMLGYANDVSADDVEKMQELQYNCKKNADGKCENPWTTSTDKIATKTLFASKKDDKSKYVKDEFLSYLKNLAEKDLTGKENLLDFYFKKHNKNIKYLPSGYVYELLDSAENKSHLAQLLGSENISKLSDDKISDLFDNTENKDEMARIILQYKKNLSDENVYNLLSNAENKTAMKELLGEKNIDKISDYNVFLLLYRAKNLEFMAKLLGSKNIVRLSDTAVSNLIQNAENKNKVKKVLKQYGRI